MIKGDTICFGYGDVAVYTFTWSNEIWFRQFKPSQECGTRVNADDVVWIGEWIKLELNEEECKWWLEKLKKVFNHQITAFEFKGYVFDFSNYNEKSINVAVKHVYRVYSYLLTVIAC